MIQINKKIVLVTSLCVFIVMAQAFTFEEKEEKAKNLKVLPKNISGDALHQLMKEYSKALGVRCSHCHVVQEGPPKKIDFVSDEKPEKDIARKMIKMQNKINKRFLAKIGNKHFEQIACVTCHMGRLKPIISVDSLAKK